MEPYWQALYAKEPSWFDSIAREAAVRRERDEARRGR
jgi:hypothetical protein